MIANILLAFFRSIGRIFSRLFRSMGHTSRTASKAGSSMAAKKAAGHEPPSEEELAETEGGGLEALLFKQLSRPRLSERSASDLTLEEARQHLKQADTFYTNPFALFARSDFFYEEVEEEFLNEALGLHQNSIDERFLRIMALFRRTLNDNTRRLMLVYAPAIMFLALTAGLVSSTLMIDPLTAFFEKQGIDFLQPALLGTLIAFATSGIAGSLLSLLLFSWPFKVVQQRNLLNLDNYLTSKFARINNNFQVAKRRALNVERNKRMSQIEELKDEAGIWTLSYQWFGLRLMLCELMIRNRLYQVRRNTVLYWLFGISICVISGGVAALGVGYLLPNLTFGLWGILTAVILYVLLTFIVFQRTTLMLFAVLEANEWSRFHLVNLHKTIQDHVGEDKVQIVTFRDRNRIE